MFDIAPSEFLLFAVIALLVIGPKDLPRAMRLAGRWVSKAKGVAGQFRSGFDAIIRESEVLELEEKWKRENDRLIQANTESALTGVAPADGPTA